MLYPLILLIGAVIFFLPYQVVRHSTINALNTQQHLLATQAATGIQDFFQHHAKTLSYLANHRSVVHLNPEGEHLIEEIQHANKDILLAITRIDATGHILFTAPRNPDVIGRDVSAQEHNKRIIETRQPLVSEVFTAVQGYRAVAFAYPVFDNGTYAGCVTLLIPFENLAKKYLANILIGEGGYAWMLSRGGVELYCPVPGHTGRTIFETSSRFPSVIAMAEQMIKGAEGATSYDYDSIRQERVETIRKHAVYYPVELPANLWSIVVATPEKQALQAVHTFGLWWLAIFAVVITGVSLLLRANIISSEAQKRHLIERKLREREHLLARFIDNAHIPIAIIDAGNATFLDLNAQFQSIYGYTLKDLHTITDWLQIVFPEESQRHSMHAAWTALPDSAGENGESTSFGEQRLTCRDGSIREALLTCTRIDQTLILTFDDHTDHNRLLRIEQELREQQSRSSKMEALGLMAGGVAHDLNNILSGVVGYPQLLLLQLTADSPLRKPVEAIHAAGVRAAAVVADLLTIARGVASKKEITSLNTLISEYLDSAEGHALKDRHPDLQFDLHLDSAPINISCSPVHIKKCIMNLITNAAESIQGTGMVRITTDVQQKKAAPDQPLPMPAGRYAMVEISDTGSGIAAEDLRHIFEPFYTKKMMGRSGTGLGLSVVWNTMQDHNGGIAVQSSSTGTTFTLFFPATTAPLRTQLVTANIDDFRGRNELVLVVDDEELQRDIATRMLKELGYRAEAACSGEEALSFLSRQSVDLLLLDMLMGAGINGRITYERALQLNPNQKALIASGFSKNDDVEEASRMGAGAFIKKPYTIEELGQAVQKELQKGSP